MCGVTYFRVKDQALQCLIARSAVPGAQVWMARPVAVREQAQALLRRGDTAAALHLAAAARASWAPVVAAESAFLLIHGAVVPCLARAVAATDVSLAQ